MEIENLSNEQAHARTELERQVEYYREQCRSLNASLDSSQHDSSLNSSREVANCRSCYEMKKALKQESVKIKAHYEVGQPTFT